MLGQDALRAQTTAFIATDPTSIVLTPTVRTRTAAGGWAVSDGVDRAAQTFKLIPMTYQQKPTVTVDGKERIIDYTLLGEWDAIMERGDYWITEDGKRWEIVELAPGHGYETKGLVEVHG